MKMNKKTAAAMAAMVCASSNVVSAGTVSFGNEEHNFTMNFVDVGHAGNVAHESGFGAVGHDFRMGTYEVRESMIDVYNELNALQITYLNRSPDLPLIGMSRTPDKPAVGISWIEAARFVNWLNTSQGYSEAYKFESGSISAGISLWTAFESGYDPSNQFRNSNAQYFLPSEDEWVKAAYFDGVTGVYYHHALGSNADPIPISGGGAPDGSVWGQALGTGPADVFSAGGLSPYGTMGQGGNVWEWTESALDMDNDLGSERRTFRGGSHWSDEASDMDIYTRLDVDPSSPSSRRGFRVAAMPGSVPEPSSTILIASGGVLLVLRRNRNQCGY